MNKRSDENVRALSDEAIMRTLRPFGVDVSTGLAKEIREYVEFLLFWNRRVNLTSITGPEAILERHFGESLFAAKAVPITRGRLVDIGSGAGFPALPIKFVVPKLEMTLVEPNTKKAVFLQEVVRRLNFEGVDVERRRFDELQLPSDFADFVTARALGEYEHLLAWTRCVAKPEGRAVLWIGAKDRERVSQAPGWQLEASMPIPQSRERTLLILRRAGAAQ